MPASLSGVFEEAGCTLWCWVLVGALGVLVLAVIAMFCILLRRWCSRKEEMTPPLPNLDDEAASKEPAAADWPSAPTASPARLDGSSQGLAASSGREEARLDGSSQGLAARSGREEVLSSPPRVPPLPRSPPPRSGTGPGGHRPPAPQGCGQAPSPAAHHSPHVVRAGDRAAGGFRGNVESGFSTSSTSNAGSATASTKSLERRLHGGRPAHAASLPEAAAWPIEEIIVAAAKSHELHWSLRVGASERSLVELLAEAFGMLGIATGEELLEQLRSDAGRRENAWIGTKDILMANVQSYVQEAGLEPDEARPLLSAASGLLSRSLRRFAMQAEAGGEPAPRPSPRTSRPSPKPCREEGLFSRVVPACCSQPVLELGFPGDHEEYLDKDVLLDRAFTIVDRTTAELSRITAAASRASRPEAQVLFAQRRALEESEKYISALSYIEEHMGHSDGSDCGWGPVLCGGAPLCDLDPDGGKYDCESLVSPRRAAEPQEDDQVLLRL